MAPPSFPPLHRSDVEACTFSEWYPRFKKVSPKATIIKPLDDKFIEYLECDRIFVPAGSGHDLDEDDDSDDGDSVDSDDETSKFTFPELDAKIRTIVDKYDGAVFPKLNWSSPQDAAWMLPGSTCRCQTPADIYLLLKSSDFVTNDLDRAFRGCVDVENDDADDSDGDSDTERVHSLDYETLKRATEEDEGDESDDDKDEAPKKQQKRRDYPLELVLKKWYDMPRSQEWRCFVRLGRLVAITQRDNNYYDFLQGGSIQRQLRGMIEDFFADEIRGKFPSDNYTFDVYFTKGNDRVFLIDFNPWSPTTDSLLFTWDELNSLSPVALPLHPHMRTITSAAMASQSMPAFSHNRYPRDIVDLSNGASVNELAESFTALLAKGVQDTINTPESGSSRASSRKE